MKRIYKTFMNFKQAHRRERGVALVFTLGILGLLMVIALGFASSATTERKVASNNNSVNAAQFLARAGLDRVVAGMNYYMLMSGGAETDSYPMHNFYSSTPTGTNSGTYDWIWKIRTPLLASDSIIPATYNGSAISWQYVKNTGATGATEEIAGRFAFASIGASGRLDPSACVDTAAAEGFEIRNGINVNEINIHNLDSALATPFNNIRTLLPAGQRWATYDKLYTEVCAAETDTASTCDKMTGWFKIGDMPDPEAFYDGVTSTRKPAENYYHRFDMQSKLQSYLPAAGNQITQGNFTKIFNSPNVLYSDATVTTPDGIYWLKKIYTADAAKAYQITANLVDYCSPIDALVTSGNLSGGLILPNTWGDSGVGPIFVGQKRVPLINQITCAATGEITVAPNAGNPALFDYTYNIVPSLGVELIDIYGGSKDGTFAANNANVRIYGKLYCDYNTTSGLSPELLWDSTATGPLELVYNGVWPSTSYFTKKATFPLPGFASPSALGFSDDSSASYRLRFSIDHVILNYGSATFDPKRNVVYARPLDSTSETSSVTAALPADGTLRSVCIDIQADDPRQVLANTDWHMNVIPAEATSGTDPIDSLVAGTKISFGSANTGLSISALGSDPENATSPAYVSETSGQHLSTAYIHQGVMQSPWELGCIHRGKKWQTLNLTAYNSDDATCDYLSGDANILDHIKFTSATATYGKVNLNTANAAVLKALFMGIPIKINDPAVGERIYKNPGTGGTAITETVANNLVQFLLAVNGAKGKGKDADPAIFIGTKNYYGAILKNRAEILRKTDTTSKISGLRSEFCSNDIGGSSATPPITMQNKAEREQFICKFINLTKAEPADSVTVVVLAQSVKDVAGTFYKDWNSNGSNNEKTLDTDNAKKAYGYWSFDGNFKMYVPAICTAQPINAVKGTYEPGIDTITGESKLIATLYWDPVAQGTSGRWVVQRIEYSGN